MTVLGWTLPSTGHVTKGKSFSSLGCSTSSVEGEIMRIPGAADINSNPVEMECILF